MVGKKGKKCFTDRLFESNVHDQPGRRMLCLLFQCLSCSPLNETFTFWSIKVAALYQSSKIKKFYHGFCQFWVQQLCLNLASSNLGTVFSTSKYFIHSVIIFCTVVTTTSQENNISFAKRSQANEKVTSALATMAFSTGKIPDPCSRARPSCSSLLVMFQM